MPYETTLSVFLDIFYPSNLRCCGELFALAEIWHRWKDAGGKWLETCSILTTAPQVPVISADHDRMPVIFDPDNYNFWLDPDVSAASDLLNPYDARLMRRYAVSTRINHVGNDDPESPRPWNWPGSDSALFVVGLWC